jgi:hypothetical protein
MRTDGPSKILLLTDSSANPRSFPAAMRVELEQTYPYLLRNAFRDAVFYQLSFGNITTEDLISQAMAYLTHWAPDVIIVQSGLSDCRPEGFSEVEKRLLNALPGSFFGKLKKQVNNPKIIRRRQIYRVSPASFRKTLKKFKMVFASSQIFWMEICAALKYEEQRPGIARRLAEYNQIIQDIYGDGYVAVQDRLLEIGGFNGDHTHWLANAHKAAADLLEPRMRAAFRTNEAPALTLLYR